eukprot:TRINITY_DN79668_c0_g1_i1.p1 TRINITY_DN79668_c0_g1~~TRINITY_DN79668_c0_g1_i1.p1  ORF type:complete len:335 (+),score=68.30 TRINITY_DN79668_c0_g1_i1:185-1189(+)
MNSAFRLSMASTVLLLLSSTLCSSAAAQSLFGFPGHRYGGFGDDFSGYGRYPSGWDDHGGYDHYYRQPPCPRYEALQMSDWEPFADSTGTQAGGYRMRALLPGVHAKNRRTQLSSDGTEIEILGARPLPPRGQSCLPRDAKLTQDGRHELLSAKVPLPRGADVSRATVRQIREDVIEVTVPSSQQVHENRMQQPQPRVQQQQQTQRQQQRQQQQRKQPRQPQQQTQRQQPQQHHQQRRVEQHSTPQSRTSRPQQQQQQPQPRSVEEQKHRTAKAPKSQVQKLRPRPQPPVRPIVNLPPSDGVEVVEEDYIYEEKHADANAGWTDNRGEFHIYGE